MPIIPLYPQLSRWHYAINFFSVIILVIMFFSKQKSHLGIDLGAGGIKLVELKKEKNRPVLVTYGLTSDKQDVHQIAGPISSNPSSNGSGPALDNQDPKRYAELLKYVCQKSGIKAKTATVSLPVSAVFHAAVSLPVLKKEESLPILKAEMKKLLPRPIDEMALDYQLLPQAPEKKTQVYLINAVPRDVVMFYTEIFKHANLELAALEPESIALQRSLVGKDQSITMIVDIGYARSNFFIIENGAVITHSSIETGAENMDKALQKIWHLDEDLLNTAKHDLFSSLMFESSSVDRENFLRLALFIIDPIVKEIEYNMDLFLQNMGVSNRKPEKIVLTGGASMMPFIGEIISDKFKIKCFVGDPWGRVVYQEPLRHPLRKIASRMAVAIGLSLRSMV